MTSVVVDEPGEEPAVWVALRRLDQPDGAEVLREISFPSAAPVSDITQILCDAFGLNVPNVVLKMRNPSGCLIPLNASIPASSKHTPHVLEVTRLFQNVHPKPRTIPVTVISRSMKTRLQAVDRRIQRLDELLPQIKLRRHEKLQQEIECLNQKLSFLHRKLQEAESHRWRGALTRAPLW
ncbi:uncharacterized protein si:zfos-1056e6.1 [Gambusia affinis]|uniref:uncharacterized protein si:zfos-1056e6.1 n=1 Tax=Gambusia affinis TaxID=33528 RepID=UPI001CDBE1B4|nr:uncharacterized protein si:zfos-1056e6.1 [Gambusia affinis]